MAARTAKRSRKSTPQAKTKAKVKTKTKRKAKAKTRAAKPAGKAQALAKFAARARPKATGKPRIDGVRKAPAPRKPAARSGLAREALKSLAMKKVIAQVIAPIESGAAVVDAYMRDVDHPFKAEMQAARAIILGASKKLAERIKWNAPSFYYKEDLGAFNPRATEFAHLILLFPGGLGIPPKSKLLEGQQKDRREVKFHSVADVESKKRALTKLVKDWVALRDA